VTVQHYTVFCCSTTKGKYDRVSYSAVLYDTKKTIASWQRAQKKMLKEASQADVRAKSSEKVVSYCTVLYDTQRRVGIVLYSTVQHCDTRHM
jgi:hypothetical protein